MKKLILLCSLFVAATYADSTTDLFTAIEQGNVDGVKMALQNGADVRLKRHDGHSAQTLARKYVDSNLYFLYGLATLPLWVCAATKDITTTAASVVGGFFLAPALAKIKNKHLQKLNSTGFGLDKVVASASQATVLFNAARSDYPEAAFVGLMGFLALSHHFGYQTKWQHIYRLVNPEEFQLNSETGRLEVKSTPIPL